jgi:metal-responsive CopG/Arc/MetJ family transcriptional regulator
VRRPTVVQLNDELLASVDQRAAAAGVSRSAVIRTAIELFLSGSRTAEIDAAIVTGYIRLPPVPHDPWAEAAARRAIRVEPW